MGKDLISILMPVKNEELYISEAIDSVLEQDYKNLELIIVNDGSTDNTEKEVLKFTDSRIVYIPTLGIGKNKAFNLGYSKSKGNFICYFAGDDKMTPKSLSARIKPLLGEKMVTKASYSKLMTISKLKRYNNIVIPRNPNKGNQSGGTTMFNRLLAKNIFPVPETLGNEDIWSRLIINHFAEHIYHVPDITLLYRIHENNSVKKDAKFSKVNNDLSKRNMAYQLFLDKYEDRLSTDGKERLKQLTKAENFRHNKKPLPIIFLNRLSLVEKARFIFFGNPFLFWLRNKLYALFTGR